ncbi:hypothetical protein ACQEVC_35350 [Plantactinospora sp. CA-294935]|uniref:hypothetical protein n=1 Tax=Plantactinospora sp. CA-294935 TaxID=3240012 RepID=UPI003D8C412A
MADQVETWPLVEVDASSLPVREAQGLIGDALGAAIERGEPFAAIVRMPSAARDRTLPGVAERIRMLKRLRGGLGARCVGLAFVVSAEAQQHNAKAIRAADKMWGCPTLAVDDHARARAWALDRLHGNEPATGGA